MRVELVRLQNDPADEVKQKTAENEQFMLSMTDEDRDHKMRDRHDLEFRPVIKISKMEA